MKRQEVLQIAKPILFNTEMVKAILDGRKAVTRRCVKYKYSNTEMKMRTDKYGTRLIEIQKDVEGETFGYNKDGTSWRQLLPFIEKVSPFKKGDILYVRETFCYHEYARKPWYGYKANGDERDVDMRWYPSIHMPKEAARIFLRVTGVRVERLQNITPEQALCEGTKEKFPPLVVDEFIDIWNSTINKTDMDKYGWHANPWVWVIEFERLEMEVPDADM